MKIYTHIHIYVCIYEDIISNICVSCSVDKEFVRNLIVISILIIIIIAITITIHL